MSVKHSVLIVSSNQEEALKGAFPVIVQLHRLTVYSTNPVLLSVTSSPVSHSLAMAAVWILSSVDPAGAGEQ